MTICLTCRLDVEIAETERTKICPTCYQVARFVSDLEDGKIDFLKFLAAVRELDGFVETIHVVKNAWLQEIVEEMAAVAWQTYKDAGLTPEGEEYDS